MCICVCVCTRVISFLAGCGLPSSHLLPLAPFPPRTRSRTRQCRACFDHRGRKQQAWLPNTARLQRGLSAAVAGPCGCSSARPGGGPKRGSRKSYWVVHARGVSSSGVGGAAGGTAGQCTMKNRPRTLAGEVCSSSTAAAATTILLPLLASSPDAHTRTHTSRFSQQSSRFERTHKINKEIDCRCPDS